ncbi:hypothetical protein ACFL02_08755 [Planctomycetota bacterium]
MPAVPREHLRGIIERDSLTLLGLAPPGRHPAAETPTKTSDVTEAKSVQETSTDTVEKT